jgi:signal transduction histidine kinase
MENTIKNDEIDKEKMMRYLKMIKQNSYRLMRLINNLLDITKLDLGFYELNLVNVNAVELIEDIVMSVADYASSKNREVIFDTNVEEKFMALDPDKIERIILNLMSNSIKFTDEGDKIYVNFEDKEDYIEVKVKDTGIGIPEDKLNVIFDKFRQAQTLFRREHEGSGIGLYLVKQLVELHGGEISVNSTLGEGTEFVVKFPVRIIESNNENFSYGISNKIEKINIEFSDIYD